MRVYAVTKDFKLLKFKSIKEFESKYSWIDDRLAKAVTHNELIEFYDEPYNKKDIFGQGFRIILNDDQIKIHNMLNSILGK